MFTQITLFWTNCDAFTKILEIGIIDNVSSANKLLTQKQTRTHTHRK